MSIREILQLPPVGGCFKCEASPSNILCESCLKKKKVEVILLSILNIFQHFSSWNAVCV